MSQLLLTNHQGLLNISIHFALFFSLNILLTKLHDEIVPYSSMHLTEEIFCTWLYQQVYYHTIKFSLLFLKSISLYFRLSETKFFRAYNGFRRLSWKHYPVIFMLHTSSCTVMSRNLSLALKKGSKPFKISKLLTRKKTNFMGWSGWTQTRTPTKS